MLGVQINFAGEGKNANMRGKKYTCTMSHKKHIKEGRNTHKRTLGQWDIEGAWGHDYRAEKDRTDSAPPLEDDRSNVNASHSHLPCRQPATHTKLATEKVVFDKVPTPTQAL